MLAAHDESQLRTSLERILASPEFVYADRLRRFLRYSFEQTLAEASEAAFTESRIGVEVFDCPNGYDPDIDPIVRVEAKRLRAKLASYYASGAAGAHETRLWMPNGSYRLELRPPEEPPAEGIHPAPWRRKLRHHRLWILAVAALTLLGAAGSLIYAFRPRRVQPVTASGQALKALSSDTGVTGQPDVTPDGRLMAYASDRGTAGQLAIFVETLQPPGQPTRLTRDAFDAVEPALEPGGLWLVYRSLRPEGGLFVVSPRGGEPRQITPFGERPRVSPDARNIVFETPGTDGEGGQLWVTPDTGGEPRALLGEAMRARSPVWSEDGKFILFEGSIAGSQRDLWAVPFPVGEPRKLGLRPPLDFRPGSLNVLRGGSLYLQVRADGLDSIVRQPLRDLRSDGPAVRLSSDAYAEHPVPVGRQLYFASGEGQSDIVALPLDADGYVTRAGEPVADSPVDEYGASVDQTETRMAWVADRGDRRVLYWRNLPDGRQNQLALPARLIDDPVLTWNGGRVAVRALEPKRQAIWMADLPRGKAERIFGDGGPPLEWSRDGRFLLFEAAGTPRATVSRLDIYTRRAQVVLAHPEYGVRGARISPDGAWIAFHVEIAPGRRQVLLAANTGSLVPPEEWKPITTGLDLDFNPAWSNDGRRILFLSSRDGFVCLWAQPVDPKLGSVVEDAFPLTHFHAATASLRPRAGVHYRVRGPVVRRKNIYVAVDQVRSNIWSLQLKAK